MKGLSGKTSRSYAIGKPSIILMISCALLVSLAFDISYGGKMRTVEKKQSTAVGKKSQTTGTEIPDSANTGFTGSGLKIKDLKPSGSITITKPNTIIERMNINGCIVIQAKNVTIRNCRIACPGAWPILMYSGSSMTIEYTEIIGTPKAAAAIGGDNYTAQHLNVHGSVDGLYVGDNTTVENCYIHDLGFGPGSHNDGIQQSYGKNVVIRNNYITVARGSTSAILIQTDKGPIDNVAIDNNILNGGQYTIYSRIGDYRLHTPPTNVKITNNHFGRGCVYGLFSIDGTVQFKNNVWNDTKEAVKLK